MSILVAIPTFETILPETFKAVYELQGVDALEFVRGYDCAKARNEIARVAMDGGYSHVLMIDSDIVMPPESAQMLSEGDSDLVLGCYARKDGRGLIDVFIDDYTQPAKWEDVRGSGRFDVRGGGFGCAMVKVDVFRELEFPWFCFAQYPNGDILSEDLYFCERMHAAGFKVQADARVACAHATRGLLWLK